VTSFFGIKGYVVFVSLKRQDGFALNFLFQDLRENNTCSLQIALKSSAPGH